MGQAIKYGRNISWRNNRGTGWDEKGANIQNMRIARCSASGKGWLVGQFGSGPGVVTALQHYSWYEESKFKFVKSCHTKHFTRHYAKPLLPAALLSFVVCVCCELSGKSRLSCRVVRSALFVSYLYFIQKNQLGCGWAWWGLDIFGFAKRCLVCRTKPNVSLLWGVGLILSQFFLWVLSNVKKWKDYNLVVSYSIEYSCLPW